MAASARSVDSDGATTIVLENWPDAFAGETQTAKKFGFENNGDRVLGASPGPASGLEIQIVAVGTNDGASMLRIGLDVGTLSQPWGMTAADGGAGGSLAAQTYGWKITALNATGETIQSREVTLAAVAGHKADLAWNNPTGTTQNKIYRTPTPGTYGASTLRATIAAATTYTDDGSATGAGSPPSENTSGGAGPAYGTPPALSTTPLSVGNLAVGQVVFYWVNRVIPGATPEDGNPRAAITRLKEV